MPNGWIGKKTRRDLYRRDSQWHGIKTDQPICCYCGETCVTGVANQSLLTWRAKKAIATLDHIVSQKDLAEASMDDTEFYHKRKDPQNLVVTCQQCNSSKQHIPLYVWCTKTRKDYKAVIAEIARRINTPIGE